MFIEFSWKQSLGTGETEESLLLFGLSNDVKSM